MSLGTGIFLSVLIISFLLLYKWTYDRWNWKKGIKKTAYWLFFTLIITCGAIWINDLYKNYPRKQHTYYDISLGMSKEDVLYKKGQPINVIELNEVNNSMTNFYLEDLKNKEEFKNYDIWVYSLSYDNKTQLFVRFNKDTKKVFLVGCSSDISYGYQCNSILNIQDGKTEAEVLDRLGKPTEVELEDGIKTMFYKNLNLRLRLIKGKVYNLALKYKN